ncbi:MAG: hypothetical protein J6Y29_02205 [Clostridiales bacterium]|nr:hypothetical protein [Clostridiales bacterium]
MTKYCVGYKQGNNEYIYVASVDVMNVRVATNEYGAITFNNVELAKDLLDIVNTISKNQDYIVIEITTTIKEVK